MSSIAVGNCFLCSIPKAKRALGLAIVISILAHVALFSLLELFLKQKNDPWKNAYVIDMGTVTIKAEKNKKSVTKNKNGVRNEEANQASAK